MWQTSKIFIHYKIQKQQSIKTYKEKHFRVETKTELQSTYSSKSLHETTHLARSRIGSDALPAESKYSVAACNTNCTLWR